MRYETCMVSACAVNVCVCVCMCMCVCLQYLKPTVPSGSQNRNCYFLKDPSPSLLATTPPTRTRTHTRIHSPCLHSSLRDLNVIQFCIRQQLVGETLCMSQATWFQFALQKGAVWGGGGNVSPPQHPQCACACASACVRKRPWRAC